MESTVQSHMPSQLKSAIKENNLILKKENRRMMALSGTSGYGPQKPEFNVDITSSQLVDGSSLQLRGFIKTTGTYNGILKLNGSAYSLVEQITIDYNGQPILQINQDADFIAQMNRTLFEGVDERKIQDYMSLTEVDVNPAVGNKHYFNLDLSKYGSKLNYFLLTDEVATLKIKIRFNTELPRLFNGTAIVDKTVTGFELGDLQLAADFFSFENDTYNSFISRAQGETGINMTTHSFITQRTKLQNGNKNHHINGSYQYKNVVSVFYLPVNTSFTANGSAISTEDSIRNLYYQSSTAGVPGNLPFNQRINFNGEVYVNQNGTEGMSAPPDHLQSVLNAVKKYPDSYNLGAELVDQWDDPNNYQITGATFLRGNDNLKEITNSGANGFISRGILENQFTTKETQNDKTILQVGVVTTVVSIQGGQVKVDR